MTDASRFDNLSFNLLKVMSMQFIKHLLVAFTLILATAASSYAAEPINTLEKSGLFGYKPNGIAIRGFDTVAYFTESKAVKGKASIATQWNGATWHFSKQEHLDLFVADPEAYAPQYGGYCAYGVAVDNLVKIEGNLWDIVDGKLYLNYNKKLQKKWRTDIEGYINTADEKFIGLLSTL